MKFVGCLFVFMVVQAQAVVGTDSFPLFRTNFKCVADLEIFPTFVSAVTDPNHVVISWKGQPDQVIISRSHQTDANRVWESEQTIFAVTLKKSEWGNYYNGSFGFPTLDAAFHPDSQGMAWLPLWCYENSAN